MGDRRASYKTLHGIFALKAKHAFRLMAQARGRVEEDARQLEILAQSAAQPHWQSDAMQRLALVLDGALEQKKAGHMHVFELAGARYAGEKTKERMLEILLHKERARHRAREEKAALENLGELALLRKLVLPRGD